MARNFNTATYSGSLKLDRVTGIRADKPKAIPAKDLLKPNTSFKQATKSMKTVANVTTDGLKK
ncbi:hypothetical protein N9D61_02155 [Planktomarina sp.]|jgi:hypothetical protein|nr:hypothetical protein [Planktomarina sp.]